MLVAVLVAAGAAAAAVFRGGSLHAMSEARFRGTSLLVAGLGLQAVVLTWTPAWMTRAHVLAGIIVSFAFVGAFVVANRPVPGMWLAGVGVAMNLVVIAANGAMPVSASAAQAAGIAPVARPTLRHEPMTSSTALPWLGDVIPVPGIGTVLSVGDVVLAAGMARVTYASARGGVRRAGG